MCRTTTSRISSPWPRQPSLLLSLLAHTSWPWASWLSAAARYVLYACIHMHPYTIRTIMAISSFIFCSCSVCGMCMTCILILTCTYIRKHRPCCNLYAHVHMDKHTHIHLRYVCHAARTDSQQLCQLWYSCSARKRRHACFHPVWVRLRECDAILMFVFVFVFVFLCVCIYNTYVCVCVFIHNFICMFEYMYTCV